MSDPFKLCPICSNAAPLEALRCVRCGYCFQEHAFDRQALDLMGRRDRTAAILLAAFLGGLGAHKFYLREPAMGILYALLCWTFIPSLVAFGEMIWYLCMSDYEFHVRFDRPTLGPAQAPAFGAPHPVPNAQREPPQPLLIALAVLFGLVVAGNLWLWLLHP